MTKLEYLRSIRNTGTGEPPAGNIEIIYTWKSLGGNHANSLTKIYNRDQIYYVNEEHSQLFGYLIYCNQEFIVSGNNPNFNWVNGSLYDYDFGEITFGNNIITPYFTILLTKEEIIKREEELPDPDPDWIPYEGLDKQNTGHVIISEDDYKRCLTCLGSPMVSEDMLEYTREEITELAIKPALEEYFHWLPLVLPNDNPLEISSGSSVIEVNMPKWAYACAGISLQQHGTSASSLCMSPMSYAMESSLWGGYSGGYFYGQRGYSANGMRNGNALVSSLQNRALTQALVNYTRRVHYEGPYTRVDGTRYIKVYSNVNGMFNIWWTKRTLDFNDVEFQNRTRVFEYAQACIKELFGNLRRQVKSDIPGLVDYSSWLTEAKETKERITGEYKKMTKASGIMRGSL